VTASGQSQQTTGDPRAAIEPRVVLFLDLELLDLLSILTGSGFYDNDKKCYDSHGCPINTVLPNIGPWRDSEVPREKVNFCSDVQEKKKAT
jgi:hypothetical protein